jgi:Domain of unknown function (DUF4375)
MTTIDDVLAIPDATDFAIALSNLVCPRSYSDGVESLTPGERVAFHVDELEREVNNGGFSQFFGNLSGAHVPETIAALEAIGAEQMAALVREAAALLPGGTLPADQAERSSVLEAVSDSVRAAWADLDGRFCAYPEDLASLLRRYVEANQGQFRPT